MKKRFKKSDFFIGQPVWYAMDYRKDEHVFSGIITKIGSKYVTVNDTYSFFLETGSLKDYTGKLYVKKQDYHDEIEMEKSTSWIRETLLGTRYDSTPVTLEQVRAIRKILETKTEQD